ncbi:hypothetical protein KKC44_01485 [Patescibacteria group bacterium]|nr:hypothetical protein [Patescibacteria group bacterium]MBU2259254.1 hypothetical protein [Patescibacteria group bacterium]
MSKTLVTLGLIVVLVGLGTADAIFTEARLPSIEPADQEPVIRPPSQPTVTQKSYGPNVLETIVSQRFTFSNTGESGLIERIITDGTKVESRTLIKDGDRSGLIAWTDSPRVKVYFLALKEALHTSFSPQVQDLIDETQREPGRPIQNLLTFFDPAISEDRLVFIRVRERLFEFHIAKDKDDVLFGLIEELTK